MQFGGASPGIGTPALTAGGSPDTLPTTCSCGQPVNTDTGEFWHTFSDLHVPGRGIPLDLTRTYSSLNASTLGPLGYGWTDSYNMALTFDGEGNATVHEVNGSAETASISGSSYTFPSYVLATLVKNADGTFTFTRRDQSRGRAPGKVGHRIERSQDGSHDGERRRIG